MPRYTHLLQGWIADGALPDFEKFSAEPEKKKRKRKARFEREAKEAKKMKLDGEDLSEIRSKGVIHNILYFCLKLASHNLAI